MIVQQQSNQFVERRGSPAIRMKASFHVDFKEDEEDGDHVVTLPKTVSGTGGFE